MILISIPHWSDWIQVLVIYDFYFRVFMPVIPSQYVNPSGESFHTNALQISSFQSHPSSIDRNANASTSIPVDAIFFKNCFLIQSSLSLRSCSGANLTIVAMLLFFLWGNGVTALSPRFFTRVADSAAGGGQKVTIWYFRPLSSLN